MCKDWHNSEWWHGCRDYVKSRYGWKCCLCGCVSESVEVDHVLPYDNKRYSEDRKREMFSAVGNMWVLCPRCHRQKTKVFDGNKYIEDTQNTVKKILESEKRLDLWG